VPVNYDPALKDTRMNAVLSAIDSNASPGTMELGSAGFTTIIAVIPLSKPSFSESAAVLTMLGAPKSAAAIGSGTAVLARIKDGGGVVHINNLSVGVSGADINLSNTTITVGQTVTINGGTITAAP
jgi:hypothetical protein